VVIGGLWLVVLWSVLRCCGRRCCGRVIEAQACLSCDGADCGFGYGADTPLYPPFRLLVILLECGSDAYALLRMSVVDSSIALRSSCD